MTFNTICEKTKKDYYNKLLLQWHKTTKVYESTVTKNPSQV